MSPAAEQRRPPVTTLWIGRLDGVGPPLPAPWRFVLAGVDWQSPQTARIELRARLLGGGWTPWVPASVLGHDSAGGEAVAHALVGEPVWTGPADAVQLRGDRPVEGLSLHLVLAAAVAGAAVADAAADGGADGGAVAAAEADAVPPAPSTGAMAAQALPLAAPVLHAGPGQPPIIARRAWAGGLRPRAAPGYGDVRMVFVHHSVNANGYGSGEVPAMLRSIYYFHTYVRGWNDIGYNFAIDAYGRVWEARAGGIDRPVTGAQAGGYNLESTGVVLLGDFSATLPTAAAQAALARLVAWKLALHGVPLSGRVTVEVDPSAAFYTRFRPGQRVSLPRIAGHRDGCTTDCPGYDMYVNGMPALRRAAARLPGAQARLELAVGPAPGSAYALAPYPIAPGTRVRRATYLDVATVTLTVGRQLPLHGTLRGFDGAPMPAAVIAVEDLSASRSGDRETQLASAVTTADGLWVALLEPRSNLLLRALHAERPAAVSALVAVGVAPAVTLSVVPAGAGAVRASGTVLPDKRHVLLEVTHQPARRRPVVHHSVAVRDGGFDSILRLPRGRYWVRAHTPADATNVSGYSPRVAALI